MIDLEGQHVELLPARITLAGSLTQSATGGANGINLLNNVNVIPILSQIDQSGFGSATNAVS